MAPTVAVIGSNGFLGKPVVTALTTLFANKISLPIIATTRSTKDKVSDDKIKYVEADLTEANLDNLYEIFKGIDVIVELTSPNPEVFAVIEKVVAHTKPQLFIPSQFGTDLEPTEKYFPGFLGLKTQHSANVRKAGVKVVDVITALFAVPGSFLYEIVGVAGVNPDENTVAYLGSADTKFAFSKLTDIGNSVASLVAHGDYAKLPNKVRVYSGTSTQREVADKYAASHNITLKELPTISQEAALKAAKEKYSKGFSFADFLYYLQVVISQGTDQGLSFSSDERELVNPGESLWKWESF